MSTLIPAQLAGISHFVLSWTEIAEWTRTHVQPGQTLWPTMNYRTRIATGTGTRRGTASSLSIPYDTNVETPLWEALAAIPDTLTKTAADLGCGTGPLLPDLARGSIA